MASYTIQDGVIIIVDGDKKTYIPESMAAIIDDDSGMTLFRNVSGRKNAAAIKNEENNP